jgi:16S rRNA (uracil1498-N3)-methyltransferase
MKEEENFKLPRLFTTARLMDKGVIALPPAQAHYLGNVLRRKPNSKIRLFNGQDGEWLAVLQNINKKSAEVLCEAQLIAQPTNTQRIHLIFAPIKKNRMDWLIEKAVELGVTDLHPILTQNTEVRKIKPERIELQIIEAAEQCERLDIPTLHDLTKLDSLLNTWPEEIKIMACLERHKNTQTLQSTNSDIAILIGPEGGFTVQEKEQIVQSTTSVSLGDNILRAETAALKALSIIKS